MSAKRKSPDDPVKPTGTSQQTAQNDSGKTTDTEDEKQEDAGDVLRLAIQHSTLDELQLLLMNTTRFTPAVVTASDLLSFAAGQRRPRWDVMMLLMSCGSKCEYGSVGLKKALQNAFAEEGTPEACKQLIACHGLDSCLASHGLLGPVRAATKSGNKDMLDILTVTACDLGRVRKEQLAMHTLVTEATYFACVHSRKNLAEALARHGPGVKAPLHNRNSIYYAARNGYTEVLCQLLKLHLPDEAPLLLEEFGPAAMLAGASHGRIEVVALLIAHSVDPGKAVCTRGAIVSTEYPLVAAARNGNIALVLLMLRHIKRPEAVGSYQKPGPDGVSVPEHSAVMEAARHDHFVVAGHLLDTGRFGINQRETWKLSLIERAACAGEIVMVKRLHKAGAVYQDVPERQGLSLFALTMTALRRKLTTRADRRRSREEHARISDVLVYIVENMPGATTTLNKLQMRDAYTRTGGNDVWQVMWRQPEDVRTDTSADPPLLSRLGLVCALLYPEMHPWLIESAREAAKNSPVTDVHEGYEELLKMPTRYSDFCACGDIEQQVGEAVSDLPAELRKLIAYYARQSPSTYVAARWGNV
jgi:hypothetical protein